MSEDLKARYRLRRGGDSPFDVIATIKIRKHIVCKQIHSLPMKAFKDPTDEPSMAVGLRRPREPSFEGNGCGPAVVAAKKPRTFDSSVIQHGPNRQTFEESLFNHLNHAAIFKAAIQMPLPAERTYRMPSLSCIHPLDQRLGEDSPGIVSWFKPPFGNGAARQPCLESVASHFADGYPPHYFPDPERFLPGSVSNSTLWPSALAFTPRVDLQTVAGHRASEPSWLDRLQAPAQLQSLLQPMLHFMMPPPFLFAPTSAVRLEEMNQMGTNGMGASETREFPPKKLPAVIALPEDRFKLSVHQVFLRQQIEAFEASHEDVSTHTRGRNKPIKLGQVGIRCRHCANLPVAAKRKGSAYFPGTLVGLYQAAQNMRAMHLQCGVCTLMPDAVNRQFVEVMSTDKHVGAGAGRHYWAEAAKKLGLVDTDEGIRFLQITSEEGGGKQRFSMS